MTNHNPNQEVLARLIWTGRMNNVTFLGLQSGVREDLALYRSRQGSTIAIAVSESFPLQLAWKLRESEQSFAKSKP